jgi:hypothetical protein
MQRSKAMTLMKTRSKSVLEEIWSYLDQGLAVDEENSKNFEQVAGAK